MTILAASAAGAAQLYILGGVDISVDRLAIKARLDPGGYLDQRIVKAVVAGPCLSAQVRAVRRSPLAKTMLAAAKESGVVLFLTALEKTDIEKLRSWRDGLADDDLKANVRLLTPGQFVWPGGQVRFPFGTKRSEQALRSAATSLEGVLNASGQGGVLAYNAAEDSISIMGGTEIDQDLRTKLFKAGNDPEVCLAFDPESGLEAQTLKGGSLVIIGPDTPSVSWFDAITRMERLDPSTVAVLELTGKAEATVRTLQARLRAAAAELSGPRCGNPDEDMVADGFGEHDILAARIAAPSLIHFVDHWSDANRRYVRQGFWTATEAARKNLEKARNLLGTLDPSQFGRVEDLLRLSELRDGAQVFDDFSGAICFAPGFYEFEVAGKTGKPAVDSMITELKSYFDQRIEEMPFDRPLLKRRLFSNSLVLLRGEGYYANLKQTPPWNRAEGYIQEAEALAELTRKLNVKSAQVDKAFVDCLAPDPETLTAWKMLLALLDQARNLGLIMLSVAMHQWRNSDKTWTETDRILKAMALIEPYYRVMLGDGSLTGSATFRDIHTAAVLAKSELEHLVKSEKARAGSVDWYEPGQPIRGWREADNPFENFLMGLLAADSLPAKSTQSVALGVFWGGVELPVSTKIAADVLGKTLDVHGFISMGRYSGSAAKDDGIYCDLSTGEFRGFSDLLDKAGSKVLLLDDNALSGQTLESARDVLLSYGAPDIDTWVVRFSGERREGQMRMANSGIVHPAYLNGRLKGCLGETPYARSYSRKQYESPVGVFNVARSRILRYLHSNGFASIFKREGF